MRLIDADALKKYMDDCGWCDNCPDKKRLCEMDCRFPDFCTHEWQRVIDEQPTITASPWHRVEDGLPKDNTWCVFVSENKHNFEQYRWIGTYSEEWGFQDDDRFMVGNVKYWMPLPEPPKE